MTTPDPVLMSALASARPEQIRAEFTPRRTGLLGVLERMGRFLITPQESAMQTSPLARLAASLGHPSSLQAQQGAAKFAEEQRQREMEAEFRRQQMALAQAREGREATTFATRPPQTYEEQLAQAGREQRQRGAIDLEQLGKELPLRQELAPPSFLPTDPFHAQAGTWGRSPTGNWTRMPVPGMEPVVTGVPSEQQLPAVEQLFKGTPLGVAAGTALGGVRQQSIRERIASRQPIPPDPARLMLEAETLASRNLAARMQNDFGFRRRIADDPGLAQEFLKQEVQRIHLQLQTGRIAPDAGAPDDPLNLKSLIR